MTAQLTDKFTYQEKDYDLADGSGAGLFDPAKYGLKPVMKCTAFWRGYYCQYTLLGDQLILKTLQINHSDEETRPVPTAPPPLCGHMAVPSTGRFRLFASVYENIDLPIVFTGGLLLGADFINEMYRHMGFPPAYKYRQVHELLFVDGTLLEAADRSYEMAELREHMGSRGEFKDREGIAALIKRYFSLEYKW